MKGFIWKLLLAMMNLSMVYLKIGIKIIWIKFMSGLKLDQAIPFMFISWKVLFEYFNECIKILNYRFEKDLQNWFFNFYLLGCAWCSSRSLEGCWATFNGKFPITYESQNKFFSKVEEATASVTIGPLGDGVSMKDSDSEDN